MSTPVTAAPAPPAVLSIDDPTGLDPCDKCGSAGLWRIVLTTGELVFCGHHAVSNGFIPRAESHTAYESEHKSKGSEN